MKSWLLLTVAALGLGISGCGESNKITPPEDPTARLRELIAQTPRADEEAEMAALWMCGELVAPESTYVEMRLALKRVRKEFGPSNFALYDLHFSHQWEIKRAYLLLSLQGMADYRSGVHYEIDSLNELLNGEVMDTTTFSFNGSFEVTIQFPGCLNIDSVQNMYLELPSVAAIDHYGRGDGPNVYPWRLQDGRLTLLFRDAWGDCLNGCIENHFRYFRISDVSVEYVGEYRPDYDSPPPDWWEEAKAGYYHFEGRD